MVWKFMCIYISIYKPSLLIITNSFSIILTCLLFDFKISEGCSEGMFLLLLFTGNICRKKSLDQKSMKIVLVSHPSVNPRKTWRPFKLIIEGVHWRWKANIITNPLKILVWKFVDRNDWQNTHSKFC